MVQINALKMLNAKCKELKNETDTNFSKFQISNFLFLIYLETCILPNYPVNYVYKLDIQSNLISHHAIILITFFSFVCRLFFSLVLLCRSL